jgi:teichuronic acid biosynthesis glycosyltransferase TuaG
VPAVSVVTPAWNAASYIGETIASVRAQTFADWELLIVDDGSTDGTVAIVERAAAEDGRIRLLHQSHAGPSAARSLAMSQANGRFFAFLDSDDTWDPGFLQAQLAVFSRHPETALVTGNGYFFGGPFDGHPVGPAGDDSYELPITQIVEDERVIFIMTVFRREVFETIGGMDESQWTSEDYDFWLRAALAGFVFRRNPRPLARYRVRGDSLSRNRARMIRGILHTFAKAAPRCPAGTGVRAVLDGQVDRWEKELLLEEAKDALERGDVAAASQRLRTLHARGGGALVGLTAWLARLAPPAAMLAYRARLWRPSWMRRAPASPQANGRRAREAA